MQDLIDNLKAFTQTDINQIIHDIMMDTEFQKWALDLVRIEQLYKKGERGDGTDLGQYSYNTLKKYGKIDPMIDHITLKETGEFYNTFEIVLTSDSFGISANGNKFDEDGAMTNLFNRYDNEDEQLIDFNDANMEKIRERLTPIIQAQLWNIMTR